MPPTDLTASSAPSLYADSLPPTSPYHTYRVQYPSVAGNKMLVKPGSTPFMAYLQAHQSDVESITNGILSLVSTTLDNVSRLPNGELLRASEAAWLQAAAKNSIAADMNRTLQSALASREAFQRLMANAPAAEHPMYRMALTGQDMHINALQRQLQNQLADIAGDLNQSELLKLQAAAPSAKSIKIARAGQVLSVAGYALTFASYFNDYYEAATTSTNESYERFKESTLSLIFNLALSTVGGAAAGATAGSIGGPWGIVAGAVVCAIFAFLDFIVIGITGDSLAHHFLTLCDAASHWVEALATKVGEQIAPVVRPTFEDWIRWQIGDLANLLPHF